MHYHRDHRDGDIEYLEAEFSSTFFAKPADRRPLKINIIDDLEKETALDRERLSQVVQWYCSHFSYEYALVAGNERIDLNGKRAGIVTAQEQTAALRRIAEKRRELKERSIPPRPVNAVNTKSNGAIAVATKIPTPPIPRPAPAQPTNALLDDIAAAVDAVRVLLAAPDRPIDRRWGVLIASVAEEITERTRALQSALDRD